VLFERVFGFVVFVKTGQEHETWEAAGVASVTVPGASVSVSVQIALVAAAAATWTSFDRPRSRRAWVGESLILPS